MNVLAKLKLSPNTVEKTVSKIIEETKVKKIMDNMKEDIKSKIKESKENKNITWIAITPWSECSKSCGGGKSHLQRLCILPKNNPGSEKCEGDRVLLKDCNMQPCDENSILNKNSTSNSVEFSKSPIFKMIAVSKRPLRYEVNSILK